MHCHEAKILPERHHTLTRSRPIEFRPFDPEHRLGGDPHLDHECFWFRAIAPLPADQILHRVLLAYASDMMLLGTTMSPHGMHWLTHKMQEASLDHALWIHADVALDDWLLYQQESPGSGGARGLSRGLIYNRAGRLVASVAPEGLIRAPL